MKRNAMTVIGRFLLAGWPAAQRPTHTFALGEDDFLVDLHKTDPSPLRGSPALE